MARTDQMLNDADRKRKLAWQIRHQAETTMPRDSLRSIALKQAEKLEAEATALETVVRATRRAARGFTSTGQLPLARSSLQRR